MKQLPDTLLDYDTGEPIHRFLPIAQTRVADGIALSGDGKQLVPAVSQQHFEGEGRPVTVDEQCFVAFVGLSDATPNEILRFTTKWGLLGLCKHDQPASGHDLRSIDAQRSSRVRLSPCGVSESERIAVWRSYAARFAAAIQIAAYLRDGRGRDTEAFWKTLDMDPEGKRWSTDKQRRLLAAYVNTILAAATVQPMISWSHEAILEFGCRNRTRLFAALAFQLAMAVVDARIAFCAYCHKAYKPQRARQGGPNYCSRQHGTAARVRRLRRARSKNE